MNFDDFKTVRRWNALNRFLQVTLAVSLAGALNYLASQSTAHGRWNLSREHAAPLALETRKQIETAAAKAPKDSSRENPWVRIYVTLPTIDAPPESDLAAHSKSIQNELAPLLDDIQFSAAKARPNGWLRIEHANYLRGAGILATLKNRYPVIDRDTALVVTCEERCKIISVHDLFSDTNGHFFRGEEVLASALASVASGKPRMLYYTTGHGEMSFSNTAGRGLSSLAAKLRAHNIRLEPLSLTKLGEIPLDADLLLIVSPLASFHAAETEKLRRYMRDRNGRLIAFIDHGAPTVGLDDLFYEWGILVQDARVLDPVPEDALGNMLAYFSDTGHVLTKTLAGQKPLVFAQARPVRFDFGSQPDSTLHVTELAAVKNPTAWGELDYRRPPFAYNSERGDVPPPVYVAALAERALGMRMNLNSPGGRMLVLGSGDITSNAYINENALFLLSAVNWMLDRTQFVGVPPRPSPQFKLQATRADLNHVAFLFIFPPLCILLLGFSVHAWRRLT
ncbi:MAG: GldG family protein [Puniceicoccales bacterium]|jgi:hypothetical protein|nr:GldG family protein [Puniceicoccales bacterium]